jgi:hypothetical protein
MRDVKIMTVGKTCQVRAGARYKNYQIGSYDTICQIGSYDRKLDDISFIRALESKNDCCLR